jgi:hypothetical protein
MTHDFSAIFSLKRPSPSCSIVPARFAHSGETVFQRDNEASMSVAVVNPPEQGQSFASGNGV